MAKSIVFIDSRVSNYQSFIFDLADQSQVFVLDSESDGLAQMVDRLQGRTGINAIHLISHGRQGALYLGSTVLDSERLASYGVPLASIGNSLTDAGDILLYGCNVAQGDVGLQFITSLARYTGADVAGSSDVTGAEALGGDWVLEGRTGQMEVPTIAPENYQFILPAESGSNDTQSTANTLVLGSSISGNLSSNSDLDYYAVAVASAGILDLTFDRPDNAFGAYFTIKLEDVDGGVLGSFVNSSDPQHFSIGIGQAGTYYARIGNYLDYYYHDGQYSLSASHLAGSPVGIETEFNDSRTQADALALDSLIQGQLSSRSDVDYFAITVAASGYLSLNFNRPDNSYDGQFNIGLEDASGTVLAVFKDAADPQIFTIGVSQAGTYYARIASSFFGASVDDGEYSLTASHVEGSISGYETESNNTPATAEPLALDSAMAGQLSSATDIDYYAISVAASGVLSLTFNRPDDRSYIQGDGYVEFSLEDATGAVVASFANPADPQTFDIGLAAGGTYYARVNTFAANNVNAFIDSPYSLNASFSSGGTDGHETEANDTRQTADLITIEDAISGQLSSASDVDYYAIAVDSAGVLELRFDRPNTSFSDQFTISLEDASGTTLASHISSIEAQIISVGIVQTGIYYARVANTHDYGSLGDSYGLAVNHLPGDAASYENEPNNTLQIANTIAAGAVISGQLSSLDDQDYYAITVDSAGTVSVDFDGPDYYGSRSFAVDFLDASGLVLASFLDTDDPQTYSVGVAQAGTYYARVGAAHGPLSGLFRDGVYSLATAFAAGSSIGWETESNNTRETADALPENAEVFGQLSTVVDQDYFSFTVAAAGVVNLNFSAPAQSANAVFTIQLEDSDGQVIASFRDLSKPQALGAALDHAGTYYARVSSSDSYFLLSSDPYSLTVNYAVGELSGFESESNDTRETADAVAAGVAIKGQLSSATDLDYFRISIDAPCTLNLSFNHPGYAYGGYNFISIESATGEVIATFRDVTNSQNFVIGIAQAGTYYARVSSYSSSMWFGNQYQLTVSQIAGATGLDLLRADVGDDEIHGSSGANVLDGGLGYDTLVGGLGNDTYVVDALGDVVFELVSGGTDTLQTTLSTFNLAVMANIENLSYVGALDFSGTGTTEANIVTGDVGNDSLDGGAGNDTLIGSGGDDTYYVDAPNDVVLEIADEGIDTVIATVNLTLDWAHVENLTLRSGSATSGTGNALNNTMTGNNNDNLLRGEDGDDSLIGGAGADSLYGDAGNDTLNGGDGSDTLSGGSGFNLLIGGDGDDTYMINSLDFDLGDTSGNDSAIVSASFVKLPASIENVTYAEGALALPYWIDALLPDKASGRFLTLLGPNQAMGYVFPASLPSYDTSSADAHQFSGFNAAQQAYSKLALNYISSVLNLAFFEVNDPASANTISFGNNAQGNSAAYAVYPSRSFMGSDVFLDNATPGNLAPVDGEYAALTLIHELGHALGLEHPFPGHSDAPYLTGVEDSSLWTVMSYIVDPAQFHLAYSPLDIAALQYLYGVSPTARVDNDTYLLSASSANFIWDGAGLDSMDVSNLSQSATLYLEPGYWGFIGSKADTITAAGQVTVNFGTVIENLAGGAGNDFLFGDAAENLISGGLGTDTLTGGLGNDTLNGAGGRDTANHSTKAAAYTVSPDDTTGKVDISGPEGSDSLTSIERLSFLDANLGFDVDGSAGQVYRLYKAAFARTPDLAGLGSWIKAMDDGLSLEQVAATFSTSAEFQSLYGSNASNEQFVTLLYLNALGRAPEAGGVSGWATQIASGAVTRAQLLAQFSESKENKDAVQSNISKGILFATAEQAAGPAQGQSFTGSSGADSLIGSVGNDSFNGGLGNDSINGGAGLDTAVYSGNRASYTLSTNAGTLTVAGGTDGTDTLINVERIQFDDTALAFDTSGNAGQTYRLYQAAFDRTPEKQGLSDWIKGMDSGMTLRQVASGFINSAEFQGLYGAHPTDEAFISLLYQNVLNRAPDEGGKAYWLDELGRGLTREMALIGFSESGENQAALIGMIQGGIEYLPG